MTVVGKVESVWRYPVKSMRGQETNEIFLGMPGVVGDRLYAFTSTSLRSDFPYFTGRNQPKMILYRPKYRGDSCANLALDVETPSGETFAVDDPQLITELGRGMEDKHQLSLVRSGSALADCQPISLLSIQTVQQLSRELTSEVDKRRFRANIYLNLFSGRGFEEDEYVGRSLQIGESAKLSILERDPRCKMITLHPDTGEATPNLLRHIAEKHDRTTGVYSTVAAEGLIRPGDQVRLVG